ncbi:unnamed protein product [Boreogadus saida]
MERGCHRAPSWLMYGALMHSQRGRRRPPTALPCIHAEPRNRGLICVYCPTAEQEQQEEEARREAGTPPRPASPPLSPPTCPSNAS